MMLDRFVYGHVTRVSPEAPIPVCRVQNETAMLGGAGNVVRNLVALGAGVDFVSVVGEDDIAGDVDLLLRDLGGVSHRLTIEKDRLTTSKTRYVAGGQQLLRSDREIRAPVQDGIVDELVAGVEDALQDAALVVISDYGKGVVTDRLAAQVIGLAQKAGKPAIVDPKSRDFTRYAGATLITPNFKELSDAAGGEPSTEDQMLPQRGSAGRRGYRCHAGDAGRAGHVSSLGGWCRSSSHAREVFDVSGAGDTVIATSCRYRGGPAAGRRGAACQRCGRSRGGQNRNRGGLCRRYSGGTRHS